MSAQSEQVQVQLETEEELLAWYAELVATGTFVLPREARLQEGQPFQLQLRVGASAPIELTGVVTAGGPTEPLRGAVQSNFALREKVYQHAIARHGGRLNSGPGGHRRHARFSTLLKVRYRSLPALFDEFVTNISEGGLFVRTDSPLPLEAEVELSVQFPDGSEQLVRGHVVRVVTPAEAADQKCIPGIGIRFTETSDGFAAATGQLLQDYLHRPRRVLVVDDDYFFLQALSDGLMEAGFEVATAQGGRDASRKLVELLYELDAVVLDLQMPGVDGHVLLERIRRMGSEMPLTIVIVSAVPEELMAPLIGPEGADAAVSKSLLLPDLIARIRIALG